MMKLEEKEKILSLLLSLLKDPSHFEAAIHDLYFFIDKIKLEPLGNTNPTL